MKGLLFIGVMTLAACAQIAPLKPVSPDETKALVATLIETQRKKPDWMAMPKCPGDAMPEKGRRPNLSPNDCAKSPSGCLEKCNGKDGDACWALANLIQEHDKIENDVAEVLYQRSCEFGIASGCTNRASTIFERDEPEGNKCAARTFEKACGMEDPWGCTMHGFALGVGIGRTKDTVEAEKILMKACEISIEKNGPACVRANELITLIKKGQKPE
jgi:hypothetical protein